MFVFQEAFFRTIYTTRTISTVKTEIANLSNQSTYEDIKIEELLFSRNTQTETSIIPEQSIINGTTSLDVYILEITNEDTTYKIYAPKFDNISYKIDSTINTILYSDQSDILYPMYLQVDNNTLIRANIDKTDTTNFLNLEDFEQIQFSGTISKVEDNISIGDTKLNNLVSKEILNLISKNYMSNVKFDDGYYYFTNSSERLGANLVFFSKLEINNESYVLISVYEMSHIEDIVKTAATVNLYMFIVVLIILVIASFIYSREFSRPLLYINEQTKKLSVLNFEQPLLKIDSTDEFSELANNINILSSNLKTTLYRLNEQNRQLSESLEEENDNELRRRDFVSGMSHELKTPLAVIQASAEAMEHGVYDTKEEIANSLKLIQAEVSKTNKMIKDMTNVYKLDIPNYEQSWKINNLKTIIEDIDHSLQPLYTNLKLNVEFNLEDTLVLCNRDRIETVIVNLFNNAIKYTPTKEKITISLYNDYNDAVFKIRNTGSAISKRNIEKIFDPFYRVDKVRSRVEGSTGLGLYIVAQTLDRYSSKCTVESKNNYVEFTFKIKKSN
jgi:signal transduction histidine kinase